MSTTVEPATYIQLTELPKKIGTTPAELPRADLTKFEEQAQAIALANEVAQIIANRTV